MMKKTALLIISILFILSLALTAFASDIPVTETGELILEDYDVIELKAEDVVVTEETIQSYLDLMLTDLAETSGGMTELSDAFVQEYSLIYFGAQLDTVEDAKTYIRSTMEENNLKNALMEALTQKAKVVSYPKAEYDLASEYAANEIAYYAVQEELDQDELAILSGYGSAQDYIAVETDQYVTMAMIIDRILEDADVQPDPEAMDQALEQYMGSMGFDSYLSVKEFRETAGDTWLWLFEEFQYKKDLVYNLLKDRISIIE